MTTYDVLKKYGWIQHKFGNKETGFCIYGAFLHAHARVGPKARTKLTNALVKSCLPLSVTEWNDEPSRTKAEVLRVAKRAGF
jgi:hypothetical protein